MILREWKGVVVSKPKNQNSTIKVRVAEKKKHPKYGKYISKNRHYIVHDTFDCSINSTVVIREVPGRISKTKSKEVIERLES